MGNVYTDRLLPTLLDRFNHPTSKARGSEYRLKLGEAIMRIIKQCGELAVKYRHPIISSFAIAARDPDFLVRAASLSNLSELCRLLQHGILPIIYEVFTLIEYHLTYDPEVRVRQSAANLARTLFTTGDGISSGLPKWLPPDLIRDIYRILSSRHQTERSEEVLEQIEAALGAIDQQTRHSVFPSDNRVNLVKKLFILNPPET
ncbi:unnamed protein product [Protopolystoma xenopodis]|uniref:RNA polymerase II assembly factor Rtp1 C-terminal domain-containing protein n=1 Tax=Protopolystoma xenopodis TaxID=117903 RepID=A0A448WC63_9PLAT|nr:unnamed protein product [Protopolystoma xenopodis]